MIVALAALAVVGLEAAIFAGLIRSLIRQHARERDAITDKLLHLAGRTWRPPPALSPLPADELTDEDELFDDVDQGVPV